MPDVAVAIVVELHPDEVHGLHGVERDRRVGLWALWRGRDVVVFGGVGGEEGAKGGDELVVARWFVRFVICGDEGVSFLIS